MTEATLSKEWLGKGLVLFESQEYEKAIMAFCCFVLQSLCLVA